MFELTVVIVTALLPFSIHSGHFTELSTFIYYKYIFLIILAYFYLSNIFNVTFACKSIFLQWGISAFT